MVTPRLKYDESKKNEKNNPSQAIFTQESVTDFIRTHKCLDLHTIPKFYVMDGKERQTNDYTLFL